MDVVVLFHSHAAAFARIVLDLVLAPLGLAGLRLCLGGRSFLGGGSSGFARSGSAYRRNRRAFFLIFFHAGDVGSEI